MLKRFKKYNSIKIIGIKHKKLTEVVCLIYYGPGVSQFWCMDHFVCRVLWVRTNDHLWRISVLFVVDRGNILKI